MEQAINEFRIVGTLKSKSFKKIKTRAGKDAITGHLVIEVESQGKVHNHRVELFANKTTLSGELNKAYQSYKTVADEFKDADTYSKSEADVISVIGDIDYNVYKSKNGDIRENVRLRGNFPNRVDSSEPQVSQANVEIIVDDFEPEYDDNQEPTGYYKVKGYTVGYNDRGIKLMNLKVKENLGMQTQLPAGSTFNATVQINNYIVKKENTQEDVGTLFGQTQQVVQSNSYEHSLDILGGKQPLHSYTPQELESVKNNVKEQINEAQAREIKKPATTTTDQLSPEEIDNGLPF